MTSPRHLPADRKWQPRGARWPDSLNLHPSYPPMSSVFAWTPNCGVAQKSSTFAPPSHCQCSRLSHLFLTSRPPARRVLPASRCRRDLPCHAVKFVQKRPPLQQPNYSMSYQDPWTGTRHKRNRSALKPSRGGLRGTSTSPRAEDIQHLHYLPPTERDN